MDKLKNFLPVFLLVVIAIILFFTNYTPGTYLTGWDNLQTELNPLLGVKRAIFSVWEEYQSFGLVAGMGHAADLVRSLVILTMSFVLPQHLIRYTFHMSMVLIASIGMFILLKHCFGSKNKSLVFLGSLFYIFNFAVIQMMFLPYEAFSIFFGLLPWEIWIFLKTIEINSLSIKNVLLLFLINLLATPQAYTQQLFVVYILIISTLGLGILINKKSVYILKNIAVSIFIILLTNSFWLLPQIYFLTTSSRVVKEAKINQLATENVFYSNKDKGNLASFVAFEGFIYDQEGINQTPLFFAWKAHRENLAVQIAIYAAIAVILLGMFKKTPYRLPFLLTLLFIANSLLINTPPFSLINEILRSNSFVNQIFRSPFTKFAIPYALVSTYLFTAGILLIKEKSLFIKQQYIQVTLFILAVLLVLIPALPSFQGQYFSQEVKVAIPKPYFEAIEYFKKTDKAKRIALLPEYTFWGWFYNRWPASPSTSSPSRDGNRGEPASPDGGQGGGYNGSGFLWYGIEQPIVSRTFDVWSAPSESYFWEAKTALEAEDTAAFEKVLEKYNIDYLLFDHSLLPIVASTRAIQYDRITRMLEKSQKIKLHKAWGFINLYEVKQSQNIKNFISIKQNLPNIGPLVRITNQDDAYKTNGEYIFDSQKKFDKYYPFLGLTSQTNVGQNQVLLQDFPSKWVLTSTIPANQDFKLSTSSGTLDTNLYITDTTVQFITPFSFNQEGDQIKAQFPKIPVISPNLQNTQISHCREPKGKIEVQKQDKLTVSSSQGANVCFRYSADTVDQRYGYIVKIKSNNIKGQPLFFYLLDKTKEQPYVEDRLINGTNYYIVGSKFEQGLGYAFAFQNTSLPNLPSVNQLEEITLYLIPYNEVKSLFLYSSNPSGQAEFTKSKIEAKPYNYYLYKVSASGNIPENSYLNLYQTYSNGWQAYSLANGGGSSVKTYFPFFFGEKLKHVTLNNWANGWLLPSSNLQPPTYNLIIIFWPQYLECLGFILLGFTLSILVLKNLTNRQNL